MSNTHSALLTELGIIITDKGGVKKSFPFDDPVTDYLAIKAGRIPKSCRDMPTYLESMNTAISTGDEVLFGMLRRESIDSQMLEGQAADEARASKQQLMIDAGLASDERDAVLKLRDFAMNMSSSKVTQISSSADLHVIQAVNSLDEIDKVANALSSRIKEWYGLHFPELENLIDSTEGYARIVLAGRREDMSAETFENAGFPSEKTEMLEVAASNSRGGEITDASLKMVKSMSEQMIAFYNLRRSLEELIEKEMNDVAPNLSVILGTALSARMLARIGSIKKMAAMPASTIQVLGAERALFRSLKTGSEPPKHGLLFQHPMVHAAPRWQRGKIARAIAAKAVIAARVDVYSEGQGLNSTLLEKLNVRIGEIGEKFQEPTEPSRSYVHERSDRVPRRDKRQGGNRYDRQASGRREVGGRPEWARKRATESESAQYRKPGRRRGGSGGGGGGGARYRRDNDNYNDRNYDGNTYDRENGGRDHERVHSGDYSQDRKRFDTYKGKKYTGKKNKKSLGKNKKKKKKTRR